MAASLEGLVEGMVLSEMTDSGLMERRSNGETLPRLQSESFELRLELGMTARTTSRLPAATNRSIRERFSRCASIVWGSYT